MSNIFLYDIIVLVICMKVIINNKKYEVKNCKNIFAKFKGMMFLKKKTDKCYRFERCNSIHTFFCFQNLDIIMCDKSNNILFKFKNVKPNKVILPKKKVYYTYEFSSNIINIDEIKKIKIT